MYVSHTKTSFLLAFAYVCVRACVCVCRKKERKGWRKKRGRGGVAVIFSPLSPFSNNISLSACITYLTDRYHYHYHYDYDSCYVCYYYDDYMANSSGVEKNWKFFFIPLFFLSSLRVVLAVVVVPLTTTANTTILSIHSEWWVVLTSHLHVSIISTYITLRAWPALLLLHSLYVLNETLLWLIYIYIWFF